MFRSVLAPVAGYVTIAVTVFASLSGAYFVLGPGFVFREASNQVTIQWTLVSLLAGFLSAVGGGFVAGRVGRNGQAFLSLITIVLVLGVVSATYALVTRPDVFEMDTTLWGFMEAASGAAQPIWYDFLVPLVGALGVFWGGRRGCPESGV